jgi:DNA-binding response OmpR family regulator
MAILIVDDSDKLRKRLKESLYIISRDHAIYEASSGEEALGIFAADIHNIVILDISLPGISGIEILKKIKLSSPDTKVIIFTSFPSSEFREQCLAHGADYFFDKCKDYRNMLELFKRNFLENK